MKNYTEKARALEGDAFAEFAESIAVNDGITARVVADLAASGTQSDCEKIAVILSRVPFDGENGRDYYSVRYDSTFDRRYVDLYLGICAAAGLDERVYIKTLIATGYAQEGTPLARWSAAADVYLKRRAAENFELTAEYLDEYDKKFVKYGTLIAVDTRLALERLVNKLLYTKNIDKTSMRRVLMEHTELGAPLMAMYGEVNAKERAAIARLLLLYKNDVVIAEFIKENIECDRSKTVRDVLAVSVKPIKKIKDAPAYFEKLMKDGEGYTYSEWKEILKQKDAAAVADRIFFYVTGEDGVKPLVYNDGAFLDMTDTPYKPVRGEHIYVLHPLDLPQGSEILSMRIAQPFKQLDRRVYLAARRNDGYRFDFLSGSVIARADFDENFKRFGFEFCGRRSASEPLTAIAFAGDYAVGVEVELFDSSDSACCGAVSYYLKSAVIKLNKTLYISSAVPQLPSALPRREYSELTLSAYGLFSRE